MSVLSSAFAPFCAVERLRQDQAQISLAFYFDTQVICDVSAQAFRLTFEDASGIAVLVKEGETIERPAINKLQITLSNADKVTLDQSRYNYSLYNITNARTELTGVFSWAKPKNVLQGVLSPGDIKIVYNLSSNTVEVAGVIMQGTLGWTPVLATVADGNRLVQQVVDWTGGIQDKPVIGQFIGSTGFVNDLADAVDIRGASGVNWRTDNDGNWQANTFYNVNDGVYYGGNSYRRLVSGTSGATFSATNWKLIAQGGGPSAGSVSNLALATKAVTPDKTSFATLGKNLLNPATLTDGGYINPLSGLFSSGPTYCYSELIKVTPGLQYSGKGASATAMRNIAFYDVNKTFKSGGISVSTVTFTVPSEVEYVVISFLISDKATFQFEQAAAPSAYEGYTGFKLAGIKVDATALNQDSANRLVSDAEKTSWNAKLDKAGVLAAVIGASRNIFATTNVVNDSFVNNTTGSLDAGTGWKRTGAIPISASTNYVISGLPSLNSKAVRFENAAGALLSVLNISPTGLNSNTFQSPANAAQMYITLARNDESFNVNTIQIEGGTVATAYVAYNPGVKTLQSVDGAIIPITEAEKTTWNAKLDKALVVSAIIGASKNLANPAGFRDGYYLENTNIESANAQYGYTDYMAVTAGSTYTGWDGVNGMRKTCYFNASKTLIAGGSTNAVTTFTVPEGVSFVRVTYYLARKATFQFEQASAPTSFIAYNAGVKTLQSVDGAVVPTTGTAAASTEKLSLALAEKILFTGCSYEESIYAHRGKSWIAKLANFTDWLIGNMGVSGYRMIDTVDRLRKNTPTYSLAPASFRPTYVTVANNGNEYFPNNGENLDLYLEQVRILVEAIQALGAKPIIGTDYHTNNNKYVESTLKNYADRHQFPYMGIGLTGEKIMSQAYQGFWGGSHPGVRTNAFEWMEWLYFINQLPRPRKSIKIFRPRLSGQTVDQLNYDTVAQRAERFLELNVGERSLNEADGSEAYYDRLDQGTTTDPNDENHVITTYTTQLNNNEYALLLAGGSVSFADYGLFELIINKVRVESFVITIKADAGLSFYLKNNNDASKYESVLRDTELVFQVSQSVYTSFTDAVGTLYTSPGVASGTVQFAYTGKLKSYAMGKGWFLCFSAVSNVDQGSRVATTTTLTRVSDGVSITVINQKSPYRYGYSYFAGLNKPKGGWYVLTSEVAYNNGVYTISLPANSAAYFEFDKLKVLAYKAGGFSLSSLEADYSGGVLKADYVKQIEQKPYGTELLATRGFDANWNTTGGWTDGGNVLVSMPVGVRDYPPYLSTTAHIELGFDSNGFSQKTSRTVSLPVTGTNRRGWQKVIVRVVARLFPSIYNPSQTGPYFTNSPVITKNSYDLGVVCVGFRAPGSSNPSLLMRQYVGIGWSELTFETTLPIMENSVIVDLWRDCEVSNANPGWPLQVYDVSMQLA